nr:MAG TPA: hypothetical protein [Caudoviricetes sp.]
MKLHYLHRLCSYYLSLDSRKEVFLQLLLWVQKVWLKLLIATVFHGLRQISLPSSYEYLYNDSTDD